MNKIDRRRGKELKGSVKEAAGKARRSKLKAEGQGRQGAANPEAVAVSRIR